SASSSSSTSPRSALSGSARRRPRHGRHEVQFVAHDLARHHALLQIAGGAHLDRELKLIAIDLSVYNRRVAELHFLRAGYLAVRDLQFIDQFHLSVRSLTLRDPGA